MKSILLCLLVLTTFTLALALDDASHDEHQRAGDFRKSSAVSCVSYGDIHYVFARGIDRRIYVNKYENVWSGWQALGNIQFAGAPFAISRDFQDIVVFAVDYKSSLSYISLDGNNWQSGWSSYENIYFLPEVTGVSRNPGELDIFLLDLAQRPWVLSYTGSAWLSPYALDGPTLDGPYVGVKFSIQPNRGDIFALSRGRLLHGLSIGTYWSGNSEYLSSASDYLFGVPAVTAWNGIREDIFVVTANNRVRHHYWSSTAGHTWTYRDIPDVNSASDVAAVTWEQNRIDLFALGGNSEMYWSQFDGTTNSWSEQINIAEYVKFASAPTVSSGRVGRMIILGVNLAGEVIGATYATATGFSAFSPIGPTQKFLV